MLNLIMSLIQTVSKLTDKVDKLVGGPGDANAMTGQLVINYNIRSLLPKKAEVEHLLMTHAPAVVAITDSQLQSHHRVYFRGYIMYRCDGQPRTSGGALILVRRDIPFRQLDPQPGTNNGTQAVSVSVRLKRRYTVTCVSRRPKARLAEIKTILADASRQPEIISILF